MSQAKLSKRTLTEFREWLVGWTLRTIDDLFKGHGFEPVNVPADMLPHGQRRGLVECYYAGINLGNREHVRRLLSVYEDVLFEVPAAFEEGKRKLVRLLERDGFSYENGRIVGGDTASQIDLSSIPTNLDIGHLGIYLDRINGSVDSDPELAIGSTKELVEATLKAILHGDGLPFDEKDDIPALLKKVQKHLDLAPDQVEATKRGAETIKRVLSNLGSVAIGVAELRNVYGSGHGRSPRKAAANARLARLAVGCGGTLCRFLFETYEARKADKQAGRGR